MHSHPGLKWKVVIPREQLLLHTLSQHRPKGHTNHQALHLAVSPDDDLTMSLPGIAKLANPEAVISISLKFSTVFPHPGRSMMFTTLLNRLWAIPCILEHSPAVDEGVDRYGLGRGWG